MARKICEKQRKNYTREEKLEVSKLGPLYKGSNLLV